MNYKVPFRQAYATTFAGWLKYTFWCHVVIRVFPDCVDLGSDALVPYYLERPETFFEQYRFMLARVDGERSRRAA